MAQIEKRGTLQWRVRVRRKGYPQQTSTHETRAKAEEWGRAIEGEMDRGTFVSRVESESTLLGEALERYMREVTPLKKGKVRETARIKVWMAHPLAKRTLAAIRGSDLATYRDAQRRAGKADATIRLNLVIIGHMFEIARREWGMENLSNPCRNITMPKGSRQRDRRLEGDEEARLIEALNNHCRNIYIIPLVLFSIETGARRSELVKLRWENININKPVSKPTAVIIDSKNGDSREIPLSSTAIKILNDLPKAISGQVFVVSADAATRAVTAATRKAGIADFHLHDLRHEATSRLFEKGLNQMEAASVTGHKTLQMLKRYTHLRAEDLAKKLG